MNDTSLKGTLHERIDQLSNEELLELLALLGVRLDGRILSRLAPGKPRRLGLLEGKASFRIRDDFKMSDEEFLRS